MATSSSSGIIESEAVESLQNIVAVTLDYITTRSVIDWFIKLK
jgi:hypothetical protein